nr:hypothetical protein [uncultured Sulfitobacter sp.]
MIGVVIVKGRFDQQIRCRSAGKTDERRTQIQWIIGIEPPIRQAEELNPLSWHTRELHGAHCFCLPFRDQTPFGELYTIAVRGRPIRNYYDIDTRASHAQLADKVKRANRLIIGMGCHNNRVTHA